MLRKLYIVLSLVLIASFALAACGPKATEAPMEKPDEPEVTEAAPTDAAPEATVLKVWSFTNEIRTMAIAYEGVNPDVDVEYTMIPMTDGEYQTKVKAAAGTADAPDVVALEAAFVKEWVESDLLMDLGELLPYTEELQTYPAVVEVGTYDGVAKAFSYQATPGAYFYRRSIAEECLGTQEPDEVQALVADMDKFVETAAKISECGTGDYFMVGTAGAMFNPFMANRAQPWIVDDTLVVDPKVNEYVDFAKMMRDMGYESQAGQWSEGWFSGMNDTLVDANGTPKKIFSYFLPTWGLPYVLIPNSTSEDAGTDTGGDWAMINGPLAYQWGGTWVGVLDTAPNAEIAKDFVRFVALDEDNLTNWATGVYTNEYLKAIDPETPDDQQQPAGDFVSSQVVVEKIANTFDDSDLAKWLGGQNSYTAFAKAAPNVNGKLMTGSDDAIQRALQSALEQYLNDEVTKDAMWPIWLDAVRNEFPDLVIPDLPDEFMQ